MRIKCLGYVGVFATDLDAWKAFATAILGMQTQTIGTVLGLRMDDKVHRVLVHPSEKNGAAYFGWEVEDGEQLAAAASALQAKGMSVHYATAGELDTRGVTHMFWITDPLGNRIELFCGLERAEDAFQPARPLSEFRTGALGLGHAVLTVPHIDDVLPFYKDVFGMRMSDYANVPFHAVFLHVNARHHSLALLETGQAGLHHLMVEALSLDDLGKAYDAAIERGVVSVTLGRHTNDHMLSFYASSPSGFLFEYGWGGRSIDETTWSVQEMTDGPSIWGHDRSWLSEDKRAEARRLRMQVAAAGVRAPVHVTAGEFDEVERTTSDQQHGDWPK